jgi:hypothetical protein
MPAARRLLMVLRHNVDTLEDLAQYLKEGVGNRRRQLRDDAGEKAGELRGEIRAFEKVLQILDEQFNIGS